MIRENDQPAVRNRTMLLCMSHSNKSDDGIVLGNQTDERDLCNLYMQQNRQG